MSDFDFFEKIVNDKVLNIHTAYLASVVSVSGASAMVQPLTKYKAASGNAKTKSLVSALIPRNVKTSTTTVYGTTVLTPAALSVGDIVYVGVCDRDITYAKNGIISEATSRHHNINDSVILRVL